jgi:hypothetical protein
MQSGTPYAICERAIAVNIPLRDSPKNSRDARGNKPFAAMRSFANDQSEMFGFDF